MKKSSQALSTKPGAGKNPAATPGKKPGSMKPDNKSVGSKISKLHK